MYRKFEPEIVLYCTYELPCLHAPSHWQSQLRVYWLPISIVSKACGFEKRARYNFYAYQNLWIYEPGYDKSTLIALTYIAVNEFDETLYFL